MDVKNLSDSKYSIFISVTRREVREFLILKHEKHEKLKEEKCPKVIIQLKNDPH